MKIFTKKRIILAVLVLGVAALVYLGVTYGEHLKQLPIGAGVRAKILCSGVFVSGREPQSVLDEDLSFHPLLDLIKTEVDFDKKEVTARFFIFARAKAVFHEQLGGILLSGKSADDIRSWNVNIPDPLPVHPGEIPWPTGDLIDESEAPPDIDLPLLEQAVDRAFLEPDPGISLRTRAVVVVQNGRLVAEKYAPGITRDMPLISWSVAKSVTSALIGILIDQGRLDLLAPAPIPEWQKKGDLRAGITVNHLLTMSDGLRFHEEYHSSPISDVNLMLFTKPDCTAFAVSRPAAAEPGTVYNYSSGTPNILSRIMRIVINDDREYWAFPRRELFNKIGMRSAFFEADAAGNFLASANVYASARDFARFGLLYLNGGVWEGERILSEKWLKYTATPVTCYEKGGYGALFWLNRGEPDNPEDRPFTRLPRDLMMAQGYQGQFIVIVPSKKLVVVRLGMTTGGKFDIQTLVEDVIKALPE
jgi:CubicO group peptidase (beta-lactamase class C family)